MEVDKELLKGNIDSMLLSLLLDKPMYGYELSKRVREKSRGQFELKEGTLYLALKRLEKHGYIEAFWGEEAESGGGRRKYYRLLRPGEERFLQKQAEWRFMRDIMDTFFGGGAGNERQDKASN
ncbi:PadR family transcriptional regulator [Paenibacillus sp. GD4]|uniref:PadR family transcriptional regulator n=1 Tax=Paenibacillus sp. GD4 TaxID=3068890 RepID=UPI00279656F5|nr:PadR family transcriptional regulator [Paenibacillus sp. GD4]MDQ1910314.1 PadR family transcriptional regulator [Paenibacillus sp. GD4]